MLTGGDDSRSLPGIRDRREMDYAKRYSTTPRLADEKNEHTIQLSFLIGRDGMMYSAKLVAEIYFQLAHGEKHLRERLERTFGDRVVIVRPVTI